MEEPVDFETVRYLKAHNVRAWKQFQSLPFASVTLATADVRDNPRLMVHRLKQIESGEWVNPIPQPPNSVPPPNPEHTALDDTWQQVMQQLDRILTPAQSGWLQDAKLLHDDHPRYGTVIVVSNVFQRDFVRSNLLEPLVQVLGRDVAIELEGGAA